MIDITAWMKNFLQILNETFANRVWFVGLQGSYGRGEATETSDIDMVVILDELSAMELPDLERTEFTYSVHFDYSEFDEREMSLYLDCDKEYGVLNSVWLKCETWDYPTE